MAIINTSEWFSELKSGIDQTKIKVDGEYADWDKAQNKFTDLINQTRSGYGTVWWVGNGGSNSICSHLAQDVLGKLRMASFAINDPSLLTCMANDFGYENVYSRPLSFVAKKNDLLIAISSSGNSQNIVSAIEISRSIGIPIVTLSGFNPENRIELLDSDLSFYFPSSHYGPVEVGHMALLHALIEVQYFREVE